MRTNEQQDFYNRWMAKAAAIKPTGIAEYIVVINLNHKSACIKTFKH